MIFFVFCESKFNILGFRAVGFHTFYRLKYLLNIQGNNWLLFNDENYLFAALLL